MYQKRTKKKKTYPKIGKRFVKSEYEFTIYKQLQNLVHPKDNVEYEPEKLGYTISKDYNPDFVITRSDGSKLYIEAKGYFDYDDQVKMRSVKEQYPMLDIRLVFMKDSVIRKGSKTRYSDWALKNDYMFAIGSVPSDWF